MSCHRVTRLVFSTLGRAAMLAGAATLAASAAGAAPPYSVQDPPGRVARISFLSGSASFRPASFDEWTNATRNYPLTIGDHLWTDRGARAELDLGTMVVRVAPFTELSVLNLDDRTVQLRVTQGSVSIRVRERADDENLEVDTPNGAAELLMPGSYRIDVSENGDASTVTVRRGEAEVTSADATYPVQQMQAFTLSGVVSPIHRVGPPVPIDEFEDWAFARDRRAENVYSVRYVSRGTIGYCDLDDYGAWRTMPDYGPVWVPRVSVDWVPYRYGHWVWIDPWGWTWIDDAPWGFAPFHYGRWVYMPAGGWGWVPGRVIARPVYAPALVAFVGGSNWHLSFSVGSAPVGWFPLGPREPFVPAYHVSPTYVQNVNITHVNVTNVNVTNINNINYVNREAPRAVTVVSRDTFVQARPVAAAAVAVPREQVRMAQVIGTGAPIAPQRVSVLNRTADRVAAPPPVVVNRQVVVRHMPPATPASALVASPAASAPTRGMVQPSGVAPPRSSGAVTRGPSRPMAPPPAPEVAAPVHDPYVPPSAPTRGVVQPWAVPPPRSSGAVSRGPSRPLPPPQAPEVAPVHDAPMPPSAPPAAAPGRVPDFAPRHSHEPAHNEARPADEHKPVDVPHQRVEQGSANAHEGAQPRTQPPHEMQAPPEERPKADHATTEQRPADDHKQGAVRRRTPERDQKDH